MFSGVFACPTNSFHSTPGRISGKRECYAQVDHSLRGVKRAFRLSCSVSARVGYCLPQPTFALPLPAEDSTTRKESAVTHPAPDVVPVQPLEHQAQHTHNNWQGLTACRCQCGCARHQITMRLRVSSHGTKCVRFCAHVRERSGEKEIK